MPRKKDDDRKLSEEELSLWQEITRDASKLPHADYPEARSLKKGISASTEAPEESAINFASPELASSVPTPALPLRAGDFSGVDGNLTKRIRRGSYPIDRILDMHGMRREAAHEALVNTILAAVNNGQRCVLVITGKGRMTLMSEGREGVLKQELPHWLNGLSLRQHVLAFCVATAQHGGDGAFYVLLKRKRSER